MPTVGINRRGHSACQIWHQPRGEWTRRAALDATTADLTRARAQLEALQTCEQEIAELAEQTAATHERLDLLRIAERVPGKSGLVMSPFDPEARYVDVSGYASGSKVKDPWTEKIFIVP